MDEPVSEDRATDFLKMVTTVRDWKEKSTEPGAEDPDGNHWE